ncbi:MAG: hypothetical protein R3C28_25860 [Pirellulaceae bacterium]
MPTPESPIQVSFEVLKTDPNFLQGQGTRKDVAIRFENDKGKAEMRILVFSPNNAQGPVPAFMKHSFNSTHGQDFDADPDKPGKFRNGWPIGEFFQRGYGFIAVYQQDLVDHNEVSFLDDIHPLFYRQGQSFPKRGNGESCQPWRGVVRERWITWKQTNRLMRSELPSWVTPDGQKQPCGQPLKTNDLRWPCLLNCWLCKAVAKKIG